MVGRFLCAAAIAGVLVLGNEAVDAQLRPDAAQLTVEQAVQRALEQPEQRQIWESRQREARASVEREEAWPNPALAVEHEQTFEDPEAIGESFLVLEQTFPISGARGLRAEAARRRVEAARLESEVEKRELVASVRSAFYEVLHVQRQAEVYRRWLERMQAATEKMAQRVEAGESAAYDLQRMRHDLAELRAAMNTERARLLRRRAELAGLIGAENAPQGPFRMVGPLLPNRPLPNAEALGEKLASTPRLKALRVQGEAATLDYEAASRWWLPDVTALGGYKHVGVAEQTFHGFLVGVSLPLPVFYQDDGERQEALALGSQARSRQRLLRARLEAELEGRVQQCRKLRSTTQTYREAGLQDARELLETTRKSYAAGELSILELMDAYHVVLDAELRALELAFETRNCRIEVQSVVGDFDDSINSTDR